MPFPRRTFLRAAASAAVWPWAGCTRPSTPFSGTLSKPGQQLGHQLRATGFPPVSRTESLEVAIVGGGVSGLSAARTLRRAGRERFRVFELHTEVGGNGASGRNRVSAYPWGAHYLPLPAESMSDLVEFLTETGVRLGRSPDGSPVYREEFLCQDPMERLYWNGEWQEGLVPRRFCRPAEGAEIDRFFQRIQILRDERGQDGRYVFDLPTDASSTDPVWRELDRWTFAEWLSQQGFTTGPLRWYLDYCCRDDYGGGLAQVSAWAGLHYFAARRGRAAHAETQAVLTWPEGLGWFVRHLRREVEGAVETQALVTRVEAEAGGAVVDVYRADRRETVRYRAEHVIVAAPLGVVRRLMPAVSWPASNSYPWVVANLTLRGDLPMRQSGAALAWDNVCLGSSSLGYTNANHQDLNPHPSQRVLTWYRALNHTDPGAARREADARTWSQWCDEVLEDLGQPHPGIGDVVESIDVRVWGHGMICPSPGYLWDGRRQEAARSQGRIHFAHSDFSGVSVFEEAFLRGIRTAREVLGDA